MGYNVTGIDKNQTNKRNIVQCDIETQTFPFKDNTFDIVLFMEVMEHLGVNPIHALKEANRVLKKDGVMVLTTPNILRLQNLKSIILTGRQLETLKSLSQIEWFGYIGHIREYTQKELVDILQYCNFRIINSCMYEGSNHRLTRVIVSLFPSFRTSIILSCKKVIS
jgi:2-polyprenyl-3-methyl-5-hydroxy-6-metoxy-1,4-benzoquinol methylase